MARWTRRTGGAGLVLALVAPALSAQVPRDRLVTVARELVAGAHYATLITMGTDGRLQARTVEPFAPDSDFTIWIGTNPRTRKVAELARDPRVTLHYFDPKAQGYVTLQGRATVVRDPRETAARFNPAWKDFYPDRATDYVLLRVRVERLEVVSPSHGVSGDARTWRPPSANLTR